MTNVYITDLAVFLPNDPISNDEMEEVLGYIGGKPSRAKKIILKSNGIKTRHYAIDKNTKKLTHNNAELTAKAVSSVLKGRKADILSCGTSTPDQLMPGHAPMVQGVLGLECLEAMSSSGICLSGIMALKYGYAAIRAGLADTAVTTGSEVVSPMLASKNFEAESEQKLKELDTKPEVAFEKDFLRWMLSDGAGAAFLSNTPNKDGLSLKIEWIETRSYAGEMPVCMYCGGELGEDRKIKGWKEFDDSADIINKSLLAISQDVRLLNENIPIYAVEKPLAEIVEKRGLKADEVDWLLPHFSSMYFSEKMFESMKKIGFEVPKEKWFTNLTCKGNTGAASIYIILEELFNGGKLKVGQKILCFIPESGRFSTGFMLLEVV